MIVDLGQPLQQLPSRGEVEPSFHLDRRRRIHAAEEQLECLLRSPRGRAERESGPKLPLTQQSTEPLRVAAAPGGEGTFVILDLEAGARLSVSQQEQMLHERSTSIGIQAREGRGCYR